MLQEMVGQFLKSGQGTELLLALQGQGLNPQQAQGAVSATAEGAMEQLGGGGQSGGFDLAGMASSLLGQAGGIEGLSKLAAGAMGGTGAPAGAPSSGLGGLLSGVLGQAGGGSALSALAGPVAQFVAQKTGLSAAVAQTVVSLALPKLVEVLSSKTASP